MTVEELTEETPAVDELPHTDDIPPYNGDRIAEWCVDDAGDIFKVTCGDRIPKTGFIPLERTREYVLPRRDAVGDPCAICGEEIGPFAIILVDRDDNNHHYGCWAAGNG